MFKTSLLNQQRLPLVVEPELVGAQPAATVETLIELYQSREDFFRERLLEHGGLLFRGFSVKTAEDFERFVKATSQMNLLDYIDGTSPRSKISKGVYNSTEYPPPYFISLHNELSYTNRWPSRLFFCCITAPQQGGETPLVDSRKLLKSIAPHIAGQFRSKGVQYVRNLHGGRGFGLSWQSVFETEDKSAVESYLESSNIEFKWKSDGGLWLKQTRPATATHPQTGEEVWFNQADQFHPTEMDEPTRKAVLSIMTEENLPKNAYFGDGSPIDAAMLDEVRKVTRDELVLFPWQTGDVLMIDNMLTAHGRMPFVGARKILVSMT